jgi:hypothetical protein
MPRRIPTNDPVFDQYLQNTATYVTAGVSVTNGARLGLQPDEITQWDSFRTQWLAVYRIYTNLSQRSQTTTAQKNKVKKDFTEFAQPLLSRIAASTQLLLADRTVFNLPLPNRTPTPLAAIECAYNAISSKAQFTIAIGQQHSGKRVFCFFRWINLKNTNHSGPWSAVVQSVVV